MSVASKRTYLYYFPFSSCNFRSQVYTVQFNASAGQNLALAVIAVPHISIIYMYRY